MAKFSRLAIVFIFIWKSFAFGGMPNPQLITHREDHPVYFGFTLGVGSTDWSQLVARKGDDEWDYESLLLVTPKAAGDTGMTYGISIGYEVTPHFAFEANYMRFPDTRIYFSDYSIYDIDDIFSRTYAFNFLGKVIVNLGASRFRGFADAGIALVYRCDELVQSGHIGPSFGIGLDYAFSAHIIGTLAFQYYAGFGRATYSPAFDYSPFLYTVYTGLAYRF